MKYPYITYLASVVLVMATLLMATSCEEFFDINTDPNNPTTAQLGQLLTNTEVAVANSVGMSTSGLSSHLGVFMHQVTRRAAPDQYGTQGNDFMINQVWQQFYDIALQDIRVMEENATSTDDLVYRGIARLLKAYIYATIVDVWGDAPFSEATKFPDIIFPVFDDDEAIYPQILSLIDSGQADLEADAANTFTPGADDLIYGGDTDLWRKFGNTLKLKMLYQTREVGTIANRDQMIVDLITDDDLIEDGEDFELLYGASVSPENRHPLFTIDYAQQTKTFYVSIWFWQLLTGQNPDLFTGVVDPRTPYYIHKQLTPGEPAQNPHEYLEDNGFLSIHFGSIHPNQGAAQDVSQAVLGAYPAGGYYDDGSGATVNLNTGTGVAPERILPYYTRLYIEAELALDGVIAKDARTLFEDAMIESFAKVNEVMAGIGGSQTIPPIDNTDRDDYINFVLSAYDNGDTDRKLELILTQKWIASFGNSVDQYNDYRRRGYPVLFDPNNDTGPFAPTTQTGRQFLVSLPWRSEDLNLNPNAPTQKDPTSDRVFWDPN